MLFPQGQNKDNVEKRHQQTSFSVGRVMLFADVSSYTT